jgi:hypothetical protein
MAHVYPSNPHECFAFSVPITMRAISHVYPRDYMLTSSRTKEGQPVGQLRVFQLIPIPDVRSFQRCGITLGGILRNDHVLLRFLVCRQGRGYRGVILALK